MNSQDLLTNQVVYLTSLLSERPAVVEAETLWPTYVSLQAMPQTEESERVWPYIGPVRCAVDAYVHQRQPIRLRAAQGILFTLRQALAVLQGDRAGKTGW